MSNSPIDKLRNAHESEYFLEKNQELVAKMKAKLAETAREEGLEAAGIVDAELKHGLAGLGVDAASLPVLPLVPLFQVAWADGEIQKEERALLTQAAKDAGIHPGTHAQELFDAMLKAPPSQGLQDSALTYCRLVLAADGGQDSLKNIENMALAVARATGGLFGIFNNVSGEEKTALEEIAARLNG